MDQSRSNCPKIIYNTSQSLQRIRDLPANMRPREIVSMQGTAHVPDEILIALLLRVGIRGTNVVEMARDLLKRYGSLTGLARAPETELASLRGIGRVKAQILRAAFELSHRLNREATPPGSVIRSPADVAALLAGPARTLNAETFWTLLLDTRNRLKAPPLEITRGILDASLIHPREIFREAIQSNAAACILAHNHPSGDTQPSREDLAITRQLVEAGQVMNIRVLDHVILGLTTGPDKRETGFLSLREAGLVRFEGQNRAGSRNAQT